MHFRDRKEDVLVELKGCVDLQTERSGGHWRRVSAQNNRFKSDQCEVNSKENNKIVLPLESGASKKHLNLY